MQLALSTYQNRGNFYLSSKKSISYSCSSLELTNHLNNVLSVISDKVIPHPSGASVAYYKADILQSQDFSGFGVKLKNRVFNKTGNTELYRSGFQGQEEDDELKGDGNSVNYEYRMHDPRLGRFFAIDPLIKEYPHYSPYSFSGNEVIEKIELEGMEPADYLLNAKYRGKSFVAVSHATGQEGQKYYWKLCSNPSGTNVWWEQGSRYVAPKPKPKPKPYDPFIAQGEKMEAQSDHLTKSNYALKVPLVTFKHEKSPQEKFEDDLWNNGTMVDYLAYKGNQANQRYEGAKGLENFARDGLIVVNAAGQLAFVIPGGQVAGEIMMGFADIGETAFDINDYGWQAGLTNGAMRGVTGYIGNKVFKPGDFVGTQTYKVAYEGGAVHITEVTENQAVDYLNSTFNKKIEE
jgi:RHS repeat-associated protein